MNRLENVKKIPVVEVIKGMQVLLNDEIVFVQGNFGNRILITHNLKINESINCEKSKHRTLVVECEICDPLKYSQWQSVLDNGA